MQVSNNALVNRPITPPVRQTQEQDERLPYRPRPAATPPIERVIQGELVSETDLSPERVSAERERVLEGQARRVQQDAPNRVAVQSYLDVEAGIPNGNIGLDLFV